MAKTKINEQVGLWLLDTKHTKKDLAAALNIAPNTLTNKLANEFDWSWSEVCTLCKVIKCTPNDFL